MAESITSFARDALRRSPELFLLVVLVVLCGWFVDRRDVRFEEYLGERDKAFHESQRAVLEHVLANTRAVQRMADLMGHEVDGWTGVAPARSAAREGRGG